VLTKTDTFVYPSDSSLEGQTRNIVPLDLMNTKPTPVVAPVRRASIRTINVCQFLLTDTALRRKHSGANNKQLKCAYYTTKLPINKMA
jgi:hypothetical protein